MFDWATRLTGFEVIVACVLSPLSFPSFPVIFLPSALSMFKNVTATAAQRHVHIIYMHVDRESLTDDVIICHPYRDGGRLSLILLILCKQSREQ